MLGHATEQVFRNDVSLQVQGTTRTGQGTNLKFDVLQDDIEPILNKSNPDFVINCIGTIKPRINENSMTSIQEAIEINSLFPHKLLRAVKGSRTKVIQIATDCVYSGSKGAYKESEHHDPSDVYGKTKSLGEINSESFLNLRVSIVGPEVDRTTSLLEWFIKQPLNTQLNGYTNHFWNGVSTFHFAKVAKGIIKSSIFESGTYHLVPSDKVSKYDLLNLFQNEYARHDISIEKVAPQLVIDRTLATQYEDKNTAFWKCAGYDAPPSIFEMVREMKITSDLHP